MKRTVLFILLLLAAVFVYRSVSSAMARNDARTVPQAAETELPKARYELVIARVSWEEARAQAEEMGGHLAVLHSRIDYDAVNLLCLSKSVDYCWLGAVADENGSFTTWITGETMSASDFPWASGEPSGRDLDGTPEKYLCWWPLGDGTLNDQRNDILSVIAPEKTVAFLVEYDG
jgi:hypothetical protein